MGVMNFDTLMKGVHKKIPKQTVEKMIFDIGIVDKLWAKCEPQKFQQKTAYLMLYKYLYDVGYNQLNRDTKSFYEVASKTFQHNIKTYREAAAIWANGVINNMANESYRDISFKCFKGRPTLNVTLWIDSTDFPVENSVVDDGQDNKNYYSWKLKRKGVRFTTLQTADSRVVKIFGPDTPKKYDGQVVREKREWMEDCIPGETIIGDGHYYCVRNEVAGVNIIAPKPSKLPNGTIIHLTKQDIKENSQIRKIRARVEWLFGDLKKRWLCFTKPWKEDLEATRKVLYIASAVNNIVTFRKKIKE